MKIPKEIAAILGRLPAEGAIWNGRTLRVVSRWSWSWSASWTEDNPGPAGEEIPIGEKSLPILAKARGELQFERGAQGGAPCVVVRSGGARWSLDRRRGHDYNPPTGEGGQAYGVEPLVLQAGLRTVGALASKARDDKYKVVNLDGAELLATDGLSATRAQSGIFRRGFCGAHSAQVYPEIATLWGKAITVLAKPKIGGTWSLQATDACTDLVFQGLGGTLRLSARNVEIPGAIPPDQIRRAIGENGVAVFLDVDAVKICKMFENVAIWTSGQMFAWNDATDVFVSESGGIPAGLPAWVGHVDLFLRGVGKIPKGSEQIELALSGGEIKIPEKKDKEGNKLSEEEKVCEFSICKVGGGAVMGKRAIPPIDRELDVQERGLTLWRQTA